MHACTRAASRSPPASPALPPPPLPGARSRREPAAGPYAGMNAACALSWDCPPLLPFVLERASVAGRGAVRLSCRRCPSAHAHSRVQSARSATARTRPKTRYSHACLRSSDASAVSGGVRVSCADVVPRAWVDGTRRSRRRITLAAEPDREPKGVDGRAVTEWLRVQIGTRALAEAIGVGADASEDALLAHLCTTRGCVGRVVLGPDESR